MNPDSTDKGRTDPIKAFVRDTLGCNCPDEVFERIESSPGRAGDPWQQRISIGGRLLILLAQAREAQALEALIGELLAAGLAQREQGGFNRLRIVLSGGNPAELRRQAEAAWQNQPGRDGRSHLHCLHPGSLPSRTPGARDGS